MEKIPTDNLYKFISLGGLLIMLLGLSFFFGYTYKVDKLQLESYHKISKNTIDFTPLIAQQATLERKQAYLELLAKKQYHIKSLFFLDSSLTLKDLIKIKPLKYEYEGIGIELAKIQKGIEQNDVLKKEELKRIQLEQREILNNSIYYFLLGAIGFLIFLLGIFFWYWKTQSILDKKLRNESHPSRLFDLRYEALKEINNLFIQSEPKKFWEEMSKYEAYEQVAFNHKAIALFTSNYLNTHSAILDTEDLKAIKELDNISNEIQFTINPDEQTVNNAGIKMAEDFISKLKLLCDNMRNKFEKDFK